MTVREPIDRVEWALKRNEQAQWLSYTGLKLGGWLSADDEEHLITVVKSFGDMGSWARGDLAVYMRRKINARALREGWALKKKNEHQFEMMEDLADRLGVAVKTLYNEAAVCSNWAQEKRVHGDVVGFSHHKLFAGGWDVDEARSMVLLAEENEWTVGQLANHVYGERVYPVPPAGNAPAQTWEKPYALEQWFHAHNLSVRQEAADMCVFRSPWGIRVVRAVLDGNKPVIEWEEREGE